MNFRKQTQAILHYQPYEKMPVVHFGFWKETLEKWAQEGHIRPDQAQNWTDSNPVDKEITRMLGFDFNWPSLFGPNHNLWPGFEAKVVAEFDDGSKHVMQWDGTIVLQRPGAGSIPSEVGHTLKDRASWEKEYLPRLRFHPDRIETIPVLCGEQYLAWKDGGLEYLKKGLWDAPLGLYCGSMFGWVRNWLGVENAIYLSMDDPDLFKEIIDTVGNLCYQCLKYVLERGAKFDFAHFWEDICFKNGPLINPHTLRQYCGPHYKRITQLVGQYGIDIVSLDCDGLIDALIPVWLDNGVNTMFPIEVGTWNASIKPWREKYGKVIRGVGGMNKTVFAQDFAAIDAEIERLKPLVELGGYIPCPDHRIAPDAKWDNVRYYCDKFRQTFCQ